MSTQNFPGGDSMTKAMEAFRGSADEFTRLFAMMRLPGMPDGQAMLDGHKRNVEALTEANRVAIEGFQTVARRNMEMLQQAMGEVTETMRALSTSGATHDAAARQAELLRRAYERAVEHARELGGLIQKTNSDAAGVLNQRFVTAMDEVKLLVAQAKAAPQA